MNSYTPWVDTEPWVQILLRGGLGFFSSKHRDNDTKSRGAVSSQVGSGSCYRACHKTRVHSPQSFPLNGFAQLALCQFFLSVLFIWVIPWLQNKMTLQPPETTQSNFRLIKYMVREALKAICFHLFRFQMKSRELGWLPSRLSQKVPCKDQAKPSVLCPARLRSLPWLSPPTTQRWQHM